MSLYVEADYYEGNYTIDDIIIFPVDGVIFVPRDFSTLIQTDPIEVRNLDLNLFRLKLRDLEDDEKMRPYPRTHDHNTQVLLSGITYARVIEILAPYTITLEETDPPHAINLINANSNVADRININTTSVRTANSAGLQSLDTILKAAYSGAVYVDVLNSTGFAQSGVAAGIGTRSIPSSNFADAKLIAETLGIKAFQVISSAELTAEDTINGYKFIGDNPLTVGITLDNASLVQDCEFKNLAVEGTLDGGNNLHQCALQALTIKRGLLLGCGISGNLTIFAQGRCVIADCFISAAEITPTIDLSVTGVLTVLEFIGDLVIQNSDGTGAIYLNMSGNLELTNTITGTGSIDIHGDCILTNNSSNNTVRDYSIKTSIDTVVPNTWLNPTRTLTESAGLSPEESDKLLSLPSKEQTAQATWDHLL